jgi:hypothetical protein
MISFCKLSLPFGTTLCFLCLLSGCSFGIPGFNSQQSQKQHPKSKKNKKTDYEATYKKTPFLNPGGGLAGYTIEKTKKKRSDSERIETKTPPKPKAFFDILRGWLWFIIIGGILLLIISPPTFFWLVKFVRGRLNSAMKQTTTAIDNFIQENPDMAQKLKDSLHKELDTKNRKFINKKIRK